MEHRELFKLLKKLGIPVSYDHFEDNKTISAPFIVYREIAPDNFKADNITFASFSNYEIELVTIKKDIKLEDEVSALLNENNISYDKADEIWDSDEKIYHIFYEI